MFEFFSQHPKGVVLFAAIVLLLSGVVNFPGGDPRQLWWTCAGACLLAFVLIIWGFAVLIAKLTPAQTAKPLESTTPSTNPTPQLTPSDSKPATTPEPISKANPGRTFKVVKGQFGHWPEGSTFTEYELRRELGTRGVREIEDGRRKANLRTLFC